MGTNNPGQTTTFRAEGAISKRRFAKHGVGDNAALQADGVAVALLGVTTDIDAAAGKPVDVIRSGIAPVEYGGNVAKGAPLTSDAQGRAVTAAAGNRIAGFAEVAGVLGDIGAVHLAPGFAA